MTGHSIKKIFRDHWKETKQELSRVYESSHWRSIVESVEKMLGCREASNGYAEYICIKCGESKKVGFTCKSRFCTSCGKRYVDTWVNKTVEEIIDIAHRHIVFTIPEGLRGIIFRDRALIKVMMDNASRAALEVLRSRGTDAVPGILAIVHTFGRDLKFHPHVHILMTEGGLRSDKEWEDIPFLPYDLLRKKWQYYLLTEIKKRLPKTRANAVFIDEMFKGNEKGFYVNGSSKMTSSRYAARYIGRYVARPALAEYKITKYNGEEIEFWYESHETGNREYKRLRANEFIKALIDHIPPKGFKMVRHYGLYSRRTKAIAKEILKQCKRFIQLSFEFIKGKAKAKSWRERLIESFGKDPLECPKCRGEMELWRIWHPDYGEIYDFMRDTPDYEEDSKEKENKRHLGGSQWKSQLCLFPV